MNRYLLKIFISYREPVNTSIDWEKVKGTGFGLQLDILKARIKTKNLVSKYWKYVVKV